MQFAVASALIQTDQPGTTHQAQWDVAPTCCYQGFPGSWQFFLEGCRASHHGSKHCLSPTVWLIHSVIRKYLINTELYVNFSKYIDELLVAKSLTNILKFTYFNIHFRKRWLKKVLREWVFGLSLGSYESVLDDSILHYWLIKVTILFNHFKWMWSGMPKVIRNNNLAISQKWI